ncbi:hypothetical protein LTR85_005909 [Meristemomyces frigidus]|nr:hypothetical protein LTR85_005909 [Meristemomyces frigidus]
MANEHFDVIVLGYGSAGANAALQAAHLGARVLILEKHTEAGGNSFVSSANMTMPTDFHKKTKSDGRQFAAYLEEVSQDTTPKKVIDAFVEGLYELPSWLEVLGGEFEENQFKRMWTYYIPAVTFPNLDSANDIDLKIYHIKQTERCPAPTAGRRVWELLDSHLQQAPNVEIRTGVNVRAINREHTNAGRGRITGVHLDNGTDISASAVVMACGGFEADTGLKRDLLGPRRIGLLGSPANQGDGLRLAAKAGAKTWHQSAEASVLGFLPPGDDTGFALALSHPSFIFVNQKAQRFINEAKLESHRGHSDTAALDHESGKYANDPIWLIMDGANIEDQAKPVLEIFSHRIVREGYEWSEHSAQEIEKGWGKKAESIAELAKQTGLSEEALKRTLEQWNGIDEESEEPFGRPSESLRPIHPPFYAIQLTPLLYNTQGGPQRDERAQILDPDGDVIEGLYGAGELGSVWGHAYQSSTNFSETIVFGRIAGREAAALAAKRQQGVKDVNPDGTIAERAQKDPPIAIDRREFQQERMGASGFLGGQEAAMNA